MSARLPPPPRDIDLDSTDELPILRGPFPEERLSATDDFGVSVIPAATGELASRLRDLDRQLEQREDRIAQLEALIGDALNRELALRTELDKERYQAFDHAKDSGQHLEDAERELITVRTEFERREADHLSAQVEIDAQRRALAHARMEVEQRAHAYRHQAMDLAELRARSERLHEAVQTALGWRAADQQQLAAIEAQRDELRRQFEALAAGQGAQKAKPAAVSAPSVSVPPPVSTEAAATATTVAAALTPDVAALKAELAALRAGADAARAAIAVYEEQQFQISQLQSEAGKLQEQVAQLGRQLAESQRLAAQREEQLGAAGERLAELEAEVSESFARISHTQDIVQTHDIIVTADEASAATEASGTRPGLRALTAADAYESDSRPGLQALSMDRGEVPLRVLLRLEGSDEVRFPLGKRTTIGRTPDNDIQIDTTYISRHHAVVLSNAQDCVIEDLNSTNGVLVNGRRVGRQSLRDGDSLLIGNTVFTFQQFE